VLLVGCPPARSLCRRHPATAEVIPLRPDTSSPGLRGEHINCYAPLRRTGRACRAGAPRIHSNTTRPELGGPARRRQEQCGQQGRQTTRGMANWPAMAATLTVAPLSVRRFQRSPSPRAGGTGDPSSTHGQPFAWSAGDNLVKSEPWKVIHPDAACSRSAMRVPVDVFGKFGI
jgi:hypothetical protein